MPIYEYKCRKCDHQFEVLQAIGAKANGLSCADCGSEELEKQFSTFSGHSTSSSLGAAPAARCGGGSGFT